MQPADRDLHVFKIAAGVGRARPQFFDQVVGVTRSPSSQDGVDEVVLQFAAGGRVLVLTDRPVVWIEPERH